jgi:hypothetical protein
MYVKVKRQKTTIFLLVEPTDSVASVKQKLEELVQQVPFPTVAGTALPPRWPAQCSLISSYLCVLWPALFNGRTHA